MKRHYHVTKIQGNPHMGTEYHSDNTIFMFGRNRNLSIEPVVGDEVTVEILEDKNGNDTIFNKVWVNGQLSWEKKDAETV